MLAYFADNNIRKEAFIIGILLKRMFYTLIM